MGMRPAKLETFRLTSRSEELIEIAASVYGGKPRVWEEAPGDAKQWEVATTTDVLEAMVPPASTLSQHWEMWSGGGCLRRCDGETELLGERDCLCPADYEERGRLAAEGKACKPTTRLSLILPQIPDIGVWRLESHGYYAAVELAGAQTIASLATARGYMIPVRLRLDPREIKRPGQPTKKFAVPVLELSATLGQVFEVLGTGNGPLMLGPEASLKALPAPRADDRLAQLGDGQAGARSGPSLEQGLARLGENDPLQVPERTGKQRRTAAMPGNPPPVEESLVREDAPPDVDAGESAPLPPADGELPPIPMATKPQVKALQTLASKLRWSDEERHQAAGVRSFNDLTKDQARELIDAWQQELASRGGASASPEKSSVREVRSGEDARGSSAPVSADGAEDASSGGEPQPTEDTPIGPSDEGIPTGSAPPEAPSEHGAEQSPPDQPPLDDLGDFRFTAGKYEGEWVSHVAEINPTWLRLNLGGIKNPVNREIAEAHLVRTVGEVRQ